MDVCGLDNITVSSRCFSRLDSWIDDVPEVFAVTQNITVKKDFNIMPYVTVLQEYGAKLTVALRVMIVIVVLFDIWFLVRVCSKLPWLLRRRRKSKRITKRSKGGGDEVLGHDTLKMPAGEDEAATTREKNGSIANDGSTVAAGEMEGETSEASSIKIDGEMKMMAKCSTESNSDIDESTGNTADNVDCSGAAKNGVEHDGMGEDDTLEDKQISALMEHKKQRHQQLLMQHINQLRQLQSIHKIQQRKRQLNDVPYSRPIKPQREPRQDQWLQEHQQKRKQNLKQPSKQQHKQNRQQLQKEKELPQVNEPSHDPDHHTTLPCDGKSASEDHTLDMNFSTATTSVDKAESQCNATEPVGSEPSDDAVSDVEPRQTLLEETPAKDVEVSQSTASVNYSTCSPSKTQPDGTDHNISVDTEEKDDSDSSEKLCKSSVENLKDLPAIHSVQEAQGHVQPPRKTEGTDEVDVATITMTAVSENTAGTTVDVTHKEPLQKPRVAGEDKTDVTTVTCGTAATAGKISPDKLLHDIKMMEIQIRSISKRDQAPSANKQQSPVKDACISYSNALRLCSSIEDKIRLATLTAEDNIRSASLTHATSESVVADIQKGSDQSGHICEDGAQTSKLNDEASQINRCHRPGLSLLDSGFNGGVQPAHEEDIKFVPLTTSFTLIEDCDQPSEDVDSGSFLANQHHQRKRWIDSDWGQVLADNDRRATDRQQPSTNTHCSEDYLLTVAPEHIGNEDSSRHRQTGNGSHHPRGYGSASSPERSQRTARSASPLRRPVVFCPPISTEHDNPPDTKNFSHSDQSMRISADEEIRDADEIFAQLSEKCDRNIAQLKQQLERMKSYQPNVVSHDELIRGRAAMGHQKPKKQLSKASCQKPDLNKHRREHHHHHHQHHHPHHQQPIHVPRKQEEHRLQSEYDMWVKTKSALTAEERPKTEVNNAKMPKAFMTETEPSDRTATLDDSMELQEIELPGGSASDDVLANDDMKFLKQVRRSSQKIAALSRKSGFAVSSISSPLVVQSPAPADIFPDDDDFRMMSAPAVVVTKEDVRSIVEETKQMLMVDLKPPHLSKQVLQQLARQSDTKESAWCRKASHLSVANAERARTGPYTRHSRGGHGSTSSPNVDSHAISNDVDRANGDGRITQMKRHPMTHMEWDYPHKIPSRGHRQQLKQDHLVTDDNGNAREMAVRNAVSWPRANNAPLASSSHDEIGSQLPSSVERMPFQFDLDCLLDNDDDA